MIAYYVHHSGRGHLHRALSIARELDDDVTGLSTLPPPPGWTGEWVQLEPDDSAPAVEDADAGGRLHWAPVGDRGVRRRAAQLSRWLDAAHPSVFVADVSVEAALLARLHGVPVVTVALPGIRTDAAHELGYGISRRVIGAWPPEARGIHASSAADRVAEVGAISRFPISGEPAGGDKRVVVLGGMGNSDADPFPLDAARRETPDWHWDVLGADAWVEDPWPLLLASSVVITHAGQNAIAEVAAARRPAIVLPRARPFAEQLTTARALARGPWPTIVLERTPTSGWGDLLNRAASLDGPAWASFNDGNGAARAAHIIEQAAVR